MQSHVRRLSTALGSIALALTACGGAGSSEFDNSKGNPEAGPPLNNVPDGGNLTEGIGPQGTNSACVSSTANAQLANANLVVMLDKSGSMGDPAEGFDPSLKWVPVTTAMKAFFTDPNSAGLAASLQFFPQGGDLASVCAYPYGAPLVALTQLSTTMPLVSAINATMPAGGTPTLPAIEGAIQYAQTVATAHPLDKTVVVLATDGDPGFGINGQFATGCANNDIPHVAAAAQAAFKATPPIPTYVIGVGPDLQNLDAVAVAGGTKQAIMVPVNDPSMTDVAFQAALNGIRTASLPCVLSIPSPPNGEKLNPLQVNVVLVGANGKQTVLPYSADCSNTGGWHYDDLANPTQVDLCSAACTQAQGDASGKVALAFGCSTTGITQ